MSTSLQLSIASDRAPEQLDELSRELLVDLRREDDLTAEQAAREADSGERAGDVALLGQLALTFISAGAATALVKCFQSYIERDRSLRFRLKKPDGHEIELDCASFDSHELAGTLQTLQKLIE